MRKMKKFLAALTATAMLFSTMTVMAEEATSPVTGAEINGEGELEEFIDKEVFNIVLPTVTEVDFVLDPQGLLPVADAMFTGSAGSAYFDNTVSGGSPTYSDTSNDITITNKSSYAVDVKLSVTVESTDIAIVKEADLAAATVPSMYVGVIVSDGDAVAVSGNDFTAETQTLEGIAEVVSGGDATEGYKVTAVSGGNSTMGYTYSYELTSGFDIADAASVTYNLTAACDTTSDWSDVDTAATVKIVWSCDKEGGSAQEAISTLVDGVLYCAKEFDGSGNAVGFASDAEITEFKVNGITCQYVYLAEAGLLQVPYDSLVAIEQDLDKGINSWTMEWKVDGVAYETSYTYEG